jgi:hypothetical protein
MMTQASKRCAIFAGHLLLASIYLHHTEKITHLSNF